MNRQLVHLGGAGRDVNRKRVMLGKGGMGIHRVRERTWSDISPTVRPAQAGPGLLGGLDQGLRTDANFQAWANGSIP